MTAYQRILLENLAEDGSWKHLDTNGQEKRSLAKMEEAGLVVMINYANGPFWETTDKGNAELASYA